MSSLGVCNLARTCAAADRIQPRGSFSAASSCGVARCAGKARLAPAQPGRNAQAVAAPPGAARAAALLSFGSRTVSRGHAARMELACSRWLGGYRHGAPDGAYGTSSVQQKSRNWVPAFLPHSTLRTTLNLCLMRHRRFTPVSHTRSDYCVFASLTVLQ